MRPTESVSNSFPVTIVVYSLDFCDLTQHKMDVIFVIAVSDSGLILMASYLHSLLWMGLLDDAIPFINRVVWLFHRLSGFFLSVAHLLWAQLGTTLTLIIMRIK